MLRSISRILLPIGSKSLNSLQRVIQTHKSQSYARRPFCSGNDLQSHFQIEPEMLMTFTCNVCKTRSTKTFSRHSYYNGMVIITCPSCQSHHLIANNIHKFNDLGLGNVEEFLAEKGEKVQRGLHIVDQDKNTINQTEDKGSDSCEGCDEHTTHIFQKVEKDQ